MVHMVKTIEKNQDNSANNTHKKETQTKTKREFILNKNVGESSVEDIIIGIRAVNEYDTEQEEKYASYVRKPIKLIVNTFGGSVYDGFALVGVIDSSETPVYTYCFGKAMSMGFVVFAAGHKRFAHPLATFMFHQVSNTLAGKANEIEESLEQMKELQRMCNEYLFEVTDLPVKKIKKTIKNKTEWYFTASKAVEYGLADELLTSKRKKKKKVA